MMSPIGRTQTLHSVMDPARAEALFATLGETPKGPELPPFFHQIYFWEPEPPEQLGRDGHTRIGEFVPDLGLRRRMWAGGQLTFHAPLLSGVPAEKRMTIEAVKQKTGRTGPLALVSIRHEVIQDDTLRVTEMQDLVYRDEHSSDGPQPVPPTARTDETVCERFDFNTTLLFRYSALTLNGHRIHYDEDYARNVEGYSGLVVHGPLLAQMLMLMAERHLGPLRSFSFRATAPLMHHETAEFCMNGSDMWVRGPDGRQIMRAQVNV